MELQVDGTHDGIQVEETVYIQYTYIFGYIYLCMYMYTYMGYMIYIATTIYPTAEVDDEARARGGPAADTSTHQHVLF